jgi:hypothetical protein
MKGAKEVAGVVLEKIDESRLRSTVEELGLRLGPKEDLARVVLAVSERMHAAYKRDPGSFIRCNECNGIGRSDGDCPWCGQPDPDSAGQNVLNLAHIRAGQEEAMTLVVDESTAEARTLPLGLEQEKPLPEVPRKVSAPTEELDPGKMPWHAASGIFPLLEEKELRELARDIEAHGLREPIILYKGKILDGRNRDAACKLAKVQPRYQEYEGDDPVAFVVSKNIHRRHLTTSQRAAFAADLAAMLAPKAKERQIAPLKHGEDSVRANSPEREGRPREQAAKVFHISPRSVQDAVVLKKEDPALHAAVKAGKTSLHAATTKLAATKGKKLSKAEVAKLEALAVRRRARQAKQEEKWAAEVAANRARQRNEHRTNPVDEGTFERAFRWVEEHLEGVEDYAQAPRADDYDPMPRLVALRDRVQAIIECAKTRTTTSNGGS